MILFDTETTGLVSNKTLDLSVQPRIVEFSAVKLSDDKHMKIVEEMTFVCNPGVPISAEITRITGLRQSDVDGRPPFSAFYPELCRLFLGEKIMVAHNLEFDRSLLEFDLRRIGKLLHFPWPQQHICTVEASLDIKGRRMSLGELYQYASKKELKGAHRAKADTEALVFVVRWLVETKRISLK